MNQKKTIPTWLNVLCLVLIVGCLVWTVFSMITDVPLPAPIASGDASSAALQSTFDSITSFIQNCKLIEITLILALTAALFYCLLGYSKPASPFFKIFLYLFTFYSFITAIYDVNYLLQVIDIIQFGLICGLSLSINLGKTRSYIYTALFIVCAIVSNIIFTVESHTGLSASIISELVLMMILGIMVYAKYQDKAARGTN